MSIDTYLLHGHFRKFESKISESSIVVQILSKTVTQFFYIFCAGVKDRTLQQSYIFYDFVHLRIKVIYSVKSVFCVICEILSGNVPFRLGLMV